jgi:hypothetical protein
MRFASRFAIVAIVFDVLNVLEMGRKREKGRDAKRA